MNENYIAVDWGSSQLRAWHFLAGQPVASVDLPLGVSRLEACTPEAVFEQYIAPWREKASVPVIMAGMIGSDAGWQPVPYLACPASLSQLATGLKEVAENVWIVPGLKVEAENVMRGEETQLLGAMRQAPATHYVMPGTHSKWVQAEGKRVNAFSTVMTGELHHLLMTRSLIGKGLPAQINNDTVFRQGLERGLYSPAFVGELFYARAARVLGSLPRSCVAELLSGLLIGAEVAGMMTLHKPKNVTLVASTSLCRRYQQAFSLAGIESQYVAGEEAFQQGIRSLLDARC